jgi:hypothetical protein
VYHYVGVKKTQGAEVLDPEPNPDGAHDDSSYDSNSGSGEDQDHSEQVNSCWEQGSEHSLVTPVRQGKFFEGKITRVDSWAQACFIEFKDGDSGWFQLWRASEHVVLL